MWPFDYFNKKREAKKRIEQASVASEFTSRSVPRPRPASTPRPSSPGPRGHEEIYPIHSQTLYHDSSPAPSYSSSSSGRCSSSDSSSSSSYDSGSSYSSSDSGSSSSDSGSSCSSSD